MRKYKVVETTPDELDKTLKNKAYTFLRLISVTCWIDSDGKQVCIIVFKRPEFEKIKRKPK